MKFSKAYIPTQKENPSEAVIPSHQLMLRAGLIQPLAAGVYSYLPFGWRVLKKVVRIIREEMDSIGAQELYLPTLNPIEIWNETGRSDGFGEEMFRLLDRKKRKMILAPTHEEVICHLARKFIKSYKDLPQIWYQIQTKFRDEPRPRSGIIRARQFIMKDSYSLDMDENGLDHAYQLHAQAYKNIFKRCQLNFHVVGASSGLMGGSGSQEFMLESEHGEDTLILCSGCNYAANLEIAESLPVEVQSESGTLERIYTPHKRTINEVTEFLKKQPNQMMKSIVYISDNQPLMVLIRGDHEINETKLEAYLGESVRPAHPEEVKELCGGEVGFVGPIQTKKTIRIIVDQALKNQHDLTTGANENHYHYSGIELDRDVHQKEWHDIRRVRKDEKCIQCGDKLRVIHAIELGHIFKLGIKYSDSMKALFLNKDGKERPIVMGSYGIGLERIIAAAIEQNFDEKGIVWHPSLAPFLVHIIPINLSNKDIYKKSFSVYNLCNQNNCGALIDDREVSPGFKFNEADLLGIPIQIIIGGKNLKTNQIEIKVRKTYETILSPDKDLIPTIKKILTQVYSP